MNRAFASAIALAISASALPSALAQSQGMGGMDMKGMDHQGMGMKSDKKVNAKTHKASGTVTKVDADKSTVSIAHGPVRSMNWPAMTMTFKVKDKKILDKVKQGEKVDFSFVQAGNDYAITDVK